MPCRSDDSPLLHRHRSRHDQFRPRLRPADRRCAARGSRGLAMGDARPRWSRRRRCRRSSICRRTRLPRNCAAGFLEPQRMDCRPPRPPQGRRNARAGRPIGKVLAVSPLGRPVRADPALGIGGSRAGAEDLARPRRRVHPELSARRLGQPLRRNPVARSMTQEITITVPASFDAAAQRLTLNAAEEAGFPGSVRLLEEPQAAFYCWLEQYGAAEPLWEGLDTARCRAAARPDRRYRRRHLGFQLVRAATRSRRTRSPTSGGSRSASISCWAATTSIWPSRSCWNLRLVGERGRMSGPQWDHLVASCRDLKEQALSGVASANERFTVALPGRGSSLVAGAQTATLARDEVERLVLDGFFPVCDARARPYRNPGGFARLGASLRGRQRGDAPSGRFPPRPPARGCRVVQWRFAPRRGLAPAVA